MTVCRQGMTGVHNDFIVMPEKATNKKAHALSNKKPREMFTRVRNRGEEIRCYRSTKRLQPHSPQTKQRFPGGRVLCVNFLARGGRTLTRLEHLSISGRAFWSSEVQK